MIPDLQTDIASQTETAPTKGWGSYAGVVLICCLATVVAALLCGTLAEANLVLIYLLSVVAVTVCFGRGPAPASAHCKGTCWTRRCTIRTIQRSPYT